LEAYRAGAVAPAMQRIGKGRRRIRKVSKKTEGGVTGRLDGVTPRFRHVQNAAPGLPGQKTGHGVSKGPS